MIVAINHLFGEGEGYMRGAALLYAGYYPLGGYQSTPLAPSFGKGEGRNKASALLERRGRNNREKYPLDGALLCFENKGHKDSHVVLLAKDSSE